MVTFADVLELIKALGPFGAIMFGFYSVNKTLTGNYQNSVKIEKIKLNNEINSVATVLIAQLTMASKRCEYFIDIEENRNKEFMPIRSSLFRSEKSLFDKFLPRISCLSLNSIKLVTEAYEEMDSTINFFLFMEIISESNKERGEYKIINYQAVGDYMTFIKLKIDKTIESLEHEVS